MKAGDKSQGGGDSNCTPQLNQAILPSQALKFSGLTKILNFGWFSRLNRQTQKSGWNRVQPLQLSLIKIGLPFKTHYSLDVPYLPATYCSSVGPGVIASSIHNYVIPRLLPRLPTCSSDLTQDGNLDGNCRAQQGPTSLPIL